MESFHEYDQYQSYLREQPLMAVYVYATDCGVCMVDAPGIVHRGIAQQF